MILAFRATLNVNGDVVPSGCTLPTPRAHFIYVAEGQIDVEAIAGILKVRTQPLRLADD